MPVVLKYDDGIVLSAYAVFLGKTLLTVHEENDDGTFTCDVDDIHIIHATPETLGYFIDWATEYHECPT